MLLSVRDVTKRFGPVEALRGVSLSVDAGEIRAVCGENGAGKSTLMKVLMGVLRPDSGSIEIDGKPVSVASPNHAQQLGLALVSQELSLAPHLSVLDNIFLGDRRVPLFHRRTWLRDRATEALRTLGLAVDLDTPVSALTMGQRQIVEIARMLVRDARILILDEPTATLSDVEIERMMGALRSLRAQGRAVLYVTHRLGEVFDICDTVTVLRNGAEVGACRTVDIDRQGLIEWMLGRSFEDMYPQASAAPTETDGLEISHLRVPGAVNDLSLVAPRGKITCIVGQVGAGASSATRALAGLVPEAGGRIMLDGVPLPLGSRAVGHDITFVSEDRAGEGIFRRNVLENLVAARLADHARRGILSWRSLRRAARDACSNVLLDPGRLHANAFDLSGGNQQKILFARALGSARPGVLLINEPTRGVDVGARAEIYRLLRDFCARGFVVLMTSSDLEEVVGISDIVVTMYRGEFVSRYERDHVSMSAILADITHPIDQRRLAS